MEVYGADGSRIECFFTSMEQCKLGTTAGMCFNNPYYVPPPPRRLQCRKPNRRRLSSQRSRRNWRSQQSRCNHRRHRDLRNPSSAEALHRSPSSR
jgi:hypothetical protein